MSKTHETPETPEEAILRQAKEEEEALNEADLLHQRLLKLPRERRRATMEAFQSKFAGDEDFTFSFPWTDPLTERQKELQRDTQPRGYQPPSAVEVGHETATKVVVENRYKKLKTFSAKPKPGPGEVNYRQWRRAANRLLENEELTGIKKKDIVIESLSGKAADLVDTIRDESLYTILDLLDSNYKKLVDSDDLLADFYQMEQDEKGSASEFLSDLYIELSEVIKEHGATLHQMPKLILGQFIRGSRDDELILKLRLDEKKFNPPDFPELMTAVRREEARRTERKLRFGKNQKAAARSRAAQARTEEEDGLQTEQLTSRLSKLETLCGKLTTSPEVTPEVDSEPEVVAQLQRRLATVEDQLNKVKKNSFFCYRCGLDGHMAPECENKGNKELVDQKKSQRAERRKAFFDKKKQGN